MRINKGKLLRLAAALLAVLFLFLVAAYALLLWESHRQRQEAEQLFRDLRAFEIGQTPAGEAMALIRRYGGELSRDAYNWDCGDKTSWYNLAAITFPERSADFVLENRLVNNLGVRPWGVLASVVMESERVVCLHFEAMTIRSDGTVLSASVYAKPPSPEGMRAGPDFAHSGRPSYEGGWPVFTGSPGDGLIARVTHEATPEEGRRAFDINFDCLTRLRECRRACELMPSVWREMVREREAENKKLLPQESDPRCQAVLAAGEKKP